MRPLFADSLQRILLALFSPKNSDSRCVVTEFSLEPDCCFFCESDRLLFRLVAVLRFQFCIPWTAYFDLAGMEYYVGYSGSFDSIKRRRDFIFCVTFGYHTDAPT